MMQLAMLQIIVVRDAKATKLAEAILKLVQNTGYELHIDCVHDPKEGEAVVQALLTAEEAPVVMH